jgi:hypothetical protein
MVDASWFTDLPEDFEESVRIDRDQDDHRERAIRSYHVTADSQRFLTDFVDRLLDQADDMRTGSNYWLYGYYGSGKSHLLTVLDGLLDTDWLAGRQATVWDDLVGSTADEVTAQLCDDWKTVHEEFYVIPIPVNLLKYQGHKQRSFSEIVLSHAHQNPDLTGVDDSTSRGLSPQIDVAYFEKWFRTTGAWDDRETRAETALSELITDQAAYDWDADTLWTDIQKYGALADVVLPRLFEAVNGTRDGYTDLQPSDIDPEAVVNRLNELRVEREAELGRPVKLVLLLDEVSLFIGTDFERLTELQTLAENVDEVGDGDIQLVATAQAKIEDVQPKFAAHGADFSIVKDRFPHRYQLPSKHVGDIAKRRLFEKSEHGEAAVGDVLESAAVKPTESLVYTEIKQNTKPPLDSIDTEALIDFYPFLPYHAPLFLEILFNLRQEATDPAKSIFSGTARAILALMHTLLRQWVKTDERDRVITLVDFFELIKPELREILTRDMRVIEGSEKSQGIADEVATGDLEPFDLDVAKAVLLLQHVHDIVPLTEGNIAVSVMAELNGRSWISTQNRVEESLDRLQKFIRPTEDETGARYRFATQEERRIYGDAEANEADPDWDFLVEALDRHLWDRIARDLSLPESVPYDETGNEYPVAYEFRLDGTAFRTTVDAEGGLEVTIEVLGVRPDHSPETGNEETLYWQIGTEGLDDLRTHLVKWWALRAAVSGNTAPPAVERDLEQRAVAVRSKLVGAMQSGSYTVKDRTDISGLSTAVRTAVDVVYPDDFHPVLLGVTEERLQELAALTAGDPLPAWARAIQVPSPDPSTSRGKKTIQRNVLSLTGRQLRDRDDGLDVNTVLDGIVSEKPFYTAARPALRAIIWGFCRKGRLVPVDEDQNTRENSVILDADQLSTTRLKLLPRDPIGDQLEAGGFKKTTETVADGLIALQEANRRLHSSLTGLREDVQLVVDTDIRSSAVSELLEAFIDELTTRIETTSTRLETVKSQGDSLGGAIEQTNETQRWLEEVKDVWARRRPSLYQFALQITIADSGFAWVDADAQSALAAQRDALTSFNGEWWTTDGWKVLVDDTETGVPNTLQRSWETYTVNQQLSELVDRIASHPWVLPSIDLPESVLPAFERQYITPLRELKQWYETVVETVDALAAEEPDTLVTATDQIAGTVPHTIAFDDSIDELATRLDRLAAIAESCDPAEVAQIGLLPDDRQRIDQRLERLVETREVTIETTASGVIIR